MHAGLQDGGGTEKNGFQRHGYALVRGAISRADARRYEAYALMNRQHPGHYRDESATRMCCRDYDVLAESLLGSLRAKIEACAGLDLLPCSGSVRIYTHGASLDSRTDPPFREISAILTLGARSEQTWPVMLKENSEDRAVVVPPGDLLIYRGAKLPHWRETFAGEYWAEMCLSYVVAGGQYVHHRFDGRSGLGEPPVAQEQSRCIELRQEYDAALAAGEDRPCFCGGGSAYSRCHGVMVSQPDT